jgi:hypothetical protein
VQHLLKRLEQTPAQEAPFSHFYIEDVLPRDLYAALLDLLPAEDMYSRASEKYKDGEVGYVRTFFNLDAVNLYRLPKQARPLWGGVATALMSAEVKEAVFGKLHKDLVFRYGVKPAEAKGLPGFAMPTLYREVEGFEIPPHPDTRKKVVTMHLYLPRDRSQLNLGTALYRKRLLAWPFGTWHHRFVKVKQFPFQPNSGYAFVVNNTVTKKSWHGREKLPAGAGVRNTLLTTFYEKPKEGFHMGPSKRAAA